MYKKVLSNVQAKLIVPMDKVMSTVHISTMLLLIPKENSIELEPMYIATYPFRGVHGISWGVGANMDKKKHFYCYILYEAGVI